MNHPNQNEWLLYIDGKASAENAASLLGHLEQCPVCAAEVAGWKRSAQKLKRMSFPASSQIRRDRNRDPLWVATLLRWGIAAAIVLFVGFAFGRLSATRTHALEQTVAAQVHEELMGEFRADLLSALDPEREARDGFPKQLRLRVQNALSKASASMNRDLMQVVQQQRQQDQQRVLMLVKDVREQQISDCLALRRDLETAVSTADSDLQQDSRRINQLASTVLAVQKP
jgi:anti-sigma factor RsiW